MNEFEDISFKAVHTGVGFYQDIPKSSSYYEDKDEDCLLSASSTEIFHGLDKSSPQFYEQLTERLEQPILDSFKKPKEHISSVQPQTHKLKKETQKKHEVRILSDETSPLNKRQLPPWQVMKVDFAFTCGLYLIGWAMVGALFNAKAIPSPLLMFYGFCLFHQLYTTTCRSLIGCTLGEERCNMTWENGSALRFTLRGIILTLTGFVSIPLLSALFKRDLLEDYTQTRLQYNI
ncbi:MAG: hypothetical protein OXK80_03505 [Bdellovibrionales bacterium]|nr:hypothetical protein [Bdellovibrionales bacterium]